jgi:hypothetical protein
MAIFDMIIVALIAISSFVHVFTPTILAQEMTSKDNTTEGNFNSSTNMTDTNATGNISNRRNTDMSQQHNTSSLTLAYNFSLGT